MKKLQKNVNYKYKIPSYANFRVGDIVRICNARQLKKYEKSKEPYMNQLAVVIGYSTKSGAGPMTFAVKVLETQDEYLLYEYLLLKTGQRMFVPKFDPGEIVVNRSKQVDAKWVKVIEAFPNETYKVSTSKDNVEYIVKERALRPPLPEELKYRELEHKLPELEGVF